jgi:hypothetical protein
VHRAARIQKTGRGDTIKHQKLIYNSILKNTRDVQCDRSLEKRVLPEEGPVWLKNVIK